MTPADADTAAAMAWSHAAQDAICDRVEAFAHGTLVRATALPTYHDFNLLRVEDPGAAAGALVSQADRLLAGLRHRKVQVEDEAAGERLRPEFDSLGWRTERLAWMLHEGPPPEHAAPAVVVDVDEVTRSGIRHLRLEWTEHWSADETAAFLPVEDVVAEQLGVRVLAARRDGDVVGFVQWRHKPPDAEVMLVYVTPASRDGGIGGALVADATARAFALGAERVFIVADDERAAKRRYERLGFRTVWVTHDFVLELGPA